MVTDRPKQTHGTTPLGINVMAMDHIVLKVKDVDESLRFYTELLGLGSERVEEFRSGKAPFPSVRLSEDTIIDLLPSPDMEPLGAGPRNQDHYCMVIKPLDMAALAGRLEEAGVKVIEGPVPRWGARGVGSSIYMADPDENVIELRHY